MSVAVAGVGRVASSCVIPQIDAEQFATLVADQRWVDETAMTTPLVWVDVDVDQNALEFVATTPFVVVALSKSTDAIHAPDWADVVLSPDDPLRPAITDTVTRAPRAAVAFALLLRGSDERSIEHGLIAESTTYSMLQAGPEFTSWRASRDVRPADTDDLAPRVVLDRDGPCLTIGLNRPSRHNAIDVAMRDAMAEAFELALVDQTIENVVLRGEGRSFCSGGDLDSFGEFGDVAEAHVVRLLRSPTGLAARLAPRLDVHIHGATVGGGIEIAAFARRVIAAPDTSIRLPEVGFGLVPGAGGTVSLPRRIGRHRTALLGLSGATIDAPTALDWGLVDEIRS